MAGVSGLASPRRIVAGVRSESFGPQMGYASSAVGGEGTAPPGGVGDVARPLRQGHGAATAVIPKLTATLRHQRKHCVTHSDRC